jgi:uncharacterized glyoxalase superfamily metalloenzyme YdcJ
MKFCMGESDRATFERRAARALKRTLTMSGPDWLALHFKQLDSNDITALGDAQVSDAVLARGVHALADRLSKPALRLSDLPHAGFKDFTEGPAADTPVLLRQDAYKALTEPVVFTGSDGREVNAEHTARFGEIEQRFYATTPAGRALYDQCLAAFEEARAKDPTLAKRDDEAFQRLQSEAFKAFPKTLDDLLARGLVNAIWEPTKDGLQARGAIHTTDMLELTRLGYVRRDGQRYEDFLPVSAAGIFASNLNQYGTSSTAANRPEYSREQLEEIMGRHIIDTDAVYAGLDARSRLDTYEALGLLDRVPDNERSRLERSAQVGKVA